MSASAIVAALKDAGEDFEWYPTTDDMLEVIRLDMHAHMGHRGRFDGTSSVLDCGAGDGRALRALTKGDRFAIEKAQLFLEMMSNDIAIVGTDFSQQTLIDKQVDAIFSNPPYSEWEAWATKIVREGNARVVYLIIPSRWKDSSLFAQATAARQASVKVIAEFDFLDAERSARAVVDILRIDLRDSTHCRAQTVDPFDLWFDSHFKFEASKADGDPGHGSPEAVISKARRLMVGNQGLIEALENAYIDDMEQLLRTYEQFERMDPSLLREVGVTVDTVKASLKQRVAGLKTIYWKAFFDRFTKITDKLITSRRRLMLERIMRHMTIDFTAQNAHAIAVWAIKNANEYFDSQLVTVFESMIEKANVITYKSNRNTFGDEKWRYCRKPDDLQRFSLDYRVVLQHCGGIYNGAWDHERKQHNGLTERALEVIRDLRTVAHNLGFLVDRYPDEDPLRMPSWEGGKARQFNALYRGKEVMLMELRAFKNQNIHIKFHQDFMLKLNVEFGRLKGWLKSKEEASAELDITPWQAADAYKANLKLDKNQLALLGFDCDE